MEVTFCNNFMYQLPRSNVREMSRKVLKSNDIWFNSVCPISKMTTYTTAIILGDDITPQGFHRNQVLNIIMITTTVGKPMGRSHLTYLMVMTELPNSYILSSFYIKITSIVIHI